MAIDDVDGCDADDGINDDYSDDGSSTNVVVDVDVIVVGNDNDDDDDDDDKVVFYDDKHLRIKITFDDNHWWSFRVLLTYI